MITLKADSYKDFFDACEIAGLTSDGEIITTTHDYAMVLIGSLYKGTGEIITDDDGGQYEAKELLDGYHVNATGELTGLEHLYVDVDRPLVKLAGVD